MIQINISKQLQFSEGKKPLSVDIQLQEKNITAIYGNSGAGKTTLLKILAGLVKPEQGFIKVNDAVWLDTKHNINLSPQQRSIGIVFQDYALFPNMTMLQNLQYAAGKKREAAFIQHLIEMVSMQPFIHTKPGQLSGGQQQRVALIRALVRKPQLLLLDEPLAALEIKMRHSLHTALQELQQELNFTALWVSHEVSEIWQLAKEVIHLQQGEIIFQGTPQPLFSSANTGNSLQLTAQVLAIIPKDIIYTIELLAATNVITITATADEAAGIIAGDTVLIHASAFDISIKKMT